MKNNAFIGGLFLLAVATGAFGQAVAPQEVEDALTTELKDKILTLRAFYPDERLRFVADGRYLGKNTPGSWTLWANIAVATVTVKRESLVLQGERIFRRTWQQGSRIPERKKQEEGQGSDRVRGGTNNRTVGALRFSQNLSIKERTAELICPSGVAADGQAGRRTTDIALIGIASGAATSPKSRHGHNSTSSCILS